jgi:GR25 family glycosyltransferase involved in LPS biosynthesis
MCMIYLCALINLCDCYQYDRYNIMPFVPTTLEPTGGCTHSHLSMIQSCLDQVNGEVLVSSV